MQSSSSSNAVPDRISESILLSLIFATFFSLVNLAIQSSSLWSCMFVMLYKVVSASESVNEILKGDPVKIKAMVQCCLF